MKRTKADDLMKIPAIPMIIQRVMPGTWRHLSHTWCECIGRWPSCLYFLSACPPSPFCITQTKILSAPLSVSIDMPAGNSDVDFRCRVDLHVLWELRHALAKILRPLTANVICDENPWEYNTDKGRKDNKIHITIPKGTKNKLKNDFICDECTFRLSGGHQPHSSAQAHVENRSQHLRRSQRSQVCIVSEP